VRYYLGIDGGGTKTTCAIGDDSSTLATAVAGPSNVVRVGEAQARESLHQAVRHVCAAAGITPEQVAHTCIGAAGAARPEIAEIVCRILAEILCGKIEVTADMDIALEAAFDDGPGVLVLSGTGSFAYGRDQHGKIVRAGGWGFAVSDEGSAQWIGRTAITTLLHAKDALDDGAHLHPELNFPLFRGIVQAWGIASLDDLIRAANSTPAPDFSALFPVVAAAADAGDPLAQQVLTRAGMELAGLAAVAMTRLFGKVFELPDSKPSQPAARELSVPLAMAGGVFRHSALVREIFYNQIRRLDPRVKISSQVVEPVDGALRRARRAAG
jgi:N-acetylglucosamine kinase-like BadF-type ATPase